MARLKWLFTEGVTDLTSYRLGQMDERERIIKLLEDDWFHGIRLAAYLSQEGYATKPVSELKYEHDWNCVGCAAIALIKGKQK